ncbi:Vacuolar protein sorting-associated protein 11 [Podochytrium sp. JEL0797]|nr:Vacuolar protein sorting-associated protein 11 [Podochytrium sp. JEL0797]
MERPPALLMATLVPMASASPPTSFLVASTSTLFFGHASGALSLAGHSVALDKVFDWRPHEAGLTRLVSTKNVLLSIGEDASGVPILKVWNLDKIDKTTKEPLLIRSITVQVNNRVFPVTALAATESLSQVAIGLENGVVLLARGDIANPDRVVKTKVLWEGESSVTGLGFKDVPASKTSGTSTVLYISTMGVVVACNTSNGTGKEVVTKLDDIGAEVGCAIVTPPNDACSAMVIARAEGIYFYDTNGRGSCFMIEGEKTLISWFRNYLVVVTRPAVQKRRGNSNAATSALLATVSAMTQKNSETDEDEDFESQQKLGSVLTVYDLRCKLIAFQGSFEGSGNGKGRVGGGGILSVASEWDELFVLTVDQKIYRLEEKDMTTKLELLFSKNLYTLALSLVTSPPNSVLPYPTTRTPELPTSPSTHTLAPSTDPETIALQIEIHKRHADHLYTHNDFSHAMSEYLYTLGHLEPSYVIRKYLDAQRITLLVKYLESLHNASHRGDLVATADHTTLLINCYTKLAATRELDSFLRREDVVFDVDTAIRVCRGAGFYTHAVYLAERFGVHEWFLHIMVEDLKRYQDTVGYIMGLAPKEMESCLRRYGHVLVREMVGEMVDVLVVLCTTERRVVDDEESAGMGLGMGARGVEDEDSMTLSAVGVQKGGMVLMGKKKGGEDEGKGSGTRIPFAEDFIHLFVDMDEWCVMFLERVIEIRWGILLDGKGAGKKEEEGGVVEAREEASLMTVCNTLLEMYLSLSCNHAEEGGSELEEKKADERKVKALRLLQHPKTRYDLDHALILCQIHKYQPGVMFLYEKMSMYKEIIEHHMKNDEYTFMIETCMKYGHKEPSLWKMALSYFADRSTSQTHASSDPELTFILAEIDKRNLLSPLEVLQLLSQHPTVTIATIRPYLLAKINAEKKQTSENARLIASFHQETSHMKTLIHDLKTKPVVFQNSKCSLCAEALDLPSVHFMCKHGYHARCLGGGNDTVDETEVEKECPICAPEHKMVESMARSQLENGGKHDVFLKKLENSKQDRFAVIADYFGKNLFALKHSNYSTPE